MNNTLNDLSNKVFVPNKIEDLNFSVFIMITGLNESKVLRELISCKCECEFDGGKYSSNQMWHNNKCRYECKNPKEHHVRIIGLTKTVSTKSTSNNFYILLTFLSIGFC